ncbi:nuclear transport factor 2 family protein [Roseateles sp.]|uniref:nuclear transport factor 2 family protein n=1 Tax=Roseateles sp. TaxID=1971397 RepID=UPI0039ECC3AD
MTHPVDAWHELVRTRHVPGLDALLAEDVVLHSPVVHTPQKGRAITKQYLGAALAVLANDTFRYVREIRGDRDVLLEFELELAGVQVNGVDIIRWNDAGQIVDFKVMVRPLKGMQAVHQKMGELLAQMQQRPR